MKTVADLTAALASLEGKRVAASAAAKALEDYKAAQAPVDTGALDAAVATIEVLEVEFDALIAAMAVPSQAPAA